MIRITVVDDNPEVGQKIADISRNFFTRSGRRCVVVNYSKPKELLWDIEERRGSDIYCLDIEMPKLSGMELAHKIRLVDDQAYIIFITSHADFAVEGYEYQAWRFIIKDTEEEKLPMALNAILEDMDQRKKKQHYYVVENDRNTVRFSASDIYYMRIDKKYTVFYTKDGEFRERKPLAQVVAQLGAPEFYYLDKSTVVNLAHIIELGEMVRVRDGSELPVSRTQKQTVKKALSEYLRKLQ